MTQNAMRKQVITLVTRVLAARRNQNLRAEQKAHQTLVSFCQEHNIEFENAFNGAVSWLKKNSVAASMNGWV